MLNFEKKQGKQDKKNNIKKHITYNEENVDKILTAKFNLIPEPLRLLCEGKYVTNSLRGKRQLIRRVVAQVIDNASNDKELLFLSFHAIEIMFSNKSFSEEWFEERRISSLINLVKNVSKLEKSKKSYSLSLIFTFFRNPMINSFSIDEFFDSKKIFENNLAVRICYDSYFPNSLELGRPLDINHNSPIKRKKYLNSLSPYQILSLLLSDPELFYTSTNELLVERFKKDLEQGKFVVNNKTITDPVNLFKELNFFEKGIGNQRLRNLVARLASYDLLIGKKGVFTEKQSFELIKIFLEPLEKRNFDEKYVYLLGNLMSSLKGKRVMQLFINSLEKGLKRKDLTKFQKKAVEFFLSYLNSPIISKSTKKKINSLIQRKLYFDSSLFVSGKKLNVINVFDTEDMDYHYSVSKKMLSKYGKIEEIISQENAEFVRIEGENIRIILIKGDPSLTNTLLKKQIKKYKKFIAVFRGHSFMLLSHFPPNIFDSNKAENVLFIPGSCGSSSTIPAYIKHNKSILNFIANKRIGRGMINLIITKMLIDHHLSKSTPILFKDLLNGKKEEIKKEGGSISSITYASLGTLALFYSYRDYDLLNN